ncbi:TonB-dependent receptor [Pseudomonas parafulva]|uniref:TonB-dependent receptor n=1 Tax=Pseudomonas parafulva TaxID=157782 RepID=UPI00054098F8|nr:TonB-dependent receptor [Pseudomonas parafulva]AIZ33057.1 TonB-dependent receptor [Pseudomonas parafulva]
MTASRHAARAALPALALTCTLAPAPQAQAETIPPATTPLTLGAVSVSGRETGPLSSAALIGSVDVLRADTLDTLPVAYAWELFRRAPGVLLTEFNQGTTSGKLSMRGFNGEGEVNAVKLLIDGIPSNTNDGNMPFIDAVFPLDIDNIQVVRGTQDPRYGLNNIAGNVSINTRTGGDYNQARLRYGSFDTREVQLAKGIEGTNWTQNYFFARQQVGGYRDHADTERYTFSGKWFYTPDDGRYRAGLIARHYQSTAQEAGYLSADDARHDPRQSNAFNATDQGTRRVNQLSLHLDTDLTDDLAWSTKVYLNTFDDRRWTQYWRTSAQQERYANETQYGALTSLTWRPEVQGLHGFALEGGSDVNRQDNRSQRYRTLDRTRQARSRDQQFDFDTLGAYVQAEIEPVASLKVVPAYRVDRLSGHFDNRANGQQAPINDYGLIRQPKLSIAWTPWDVAGLYANWGRTFQVGTGAAAYKIPPSHQDLAPSINEGWETGITFNPTRWLDGRLAYWRQEASGEVSRRLNDPSGESDNVGETRRWGYDLQMNLHPDERTAWWLAYTWQYSRILEPSAALPASRGQEIDHVPHHVWNAGVRYQASPALQLGAWMNGQSRYYLERENTQGRYGSFVLMNLSASYRLSESVSVDLQLKNLANRYYAYVWYDPDGAQASLHSPGDGRALYAGVTFDF